MIILWLGRATGRSVSPSASSSRKGTYAIAMKIEWSAEPPYSRHICSENDDDFCRSSAYKCNVEVNFMTLKWARGMNSL